jgi:hypothetical protein
MSPYISDYPQQYEEYFSGTFDHIRERSEIQGLERILFLCRQRDFLEDSGTSDGYLQYELF